MQRYKKILVLMGVLSLVACQNVTPREQGAVLGGVLGGMIGHGISDSTTGTIAGTLVGGYVGAKVADSLDRYKPRIAETMETSRSDTATQWVDPDGAHYVLVPKAAKRDDGKVCRPFVMTIESGDRFERIHGLACRKGKENWIITRH